MSLQVPFLCVFNSIVFQVSSVRMLGISLMVFVSRDDVKYVTNVEAQYTRTGFAGYWVGLLNAFMSILASNGNP